MTDDHRNGWMFTRCAYGDTALFHYNLTKHFSFHLLSVKVALTDKFACISCMNRRCSSDVNPCAQVHCKFKIWDRDAVTLFILIQFSGIQG